MKFEVNIEKKYAYSIIAILLIASGVVIVNAYNTNNPLTFGHDSNEVDVNIGGVTKSLQQAINAGDLGGNATGGGTDINYVSLDANALSGVLSSVGNVEYIYTLADFNSAGAGLSNFEDILAYYVDVDFDTRADTVSAKLQVHNGVKYKNVFQARVGNDDNDHHQISIVVPREEIDQFRAMITTDRLPNNDLRFKVEGIYVKSGSGGAGGSSPSTVSLVDCATTRYINLVDDQEIFCPQPNQVMRGFSVNIAGGDFTAGEVNCCTIQIS